MFYFQINCTILLSQFKSRVCNLSLFQTMRIKFVRKSFYFGYNGVQFDLEVDGHVSSTILDVSQFVKE